MKEYKRLTKYSEENQDYITPYCDTANCNGVCLDCDYEQVIINRLADLENKIENGTLIELPCKVGDVVYQFDNGGRIYEATILNIEIYKGKPYYETCGVDFDNTAIGESIFLTKAEAEAKLKEVQEV